MIIRFKAARTLTKGSANFNRAETRNTELAPDNLPAPARSKDDRAIACRTSAVTPRGTIVNANSETNFRKFPKENSVLRN